MTNHFDFDPWDSRLQKPQYLNEAFQVETNFN